MYLLKVSFISSFLIFTLSIFNSAEASNDLCGKRLSWKEERNHSPDDFTHNYSFRGYLERNYEVTEKFAAEFEKDHGQKINQLSHGDVIDHLHDIFSGELSQANEFLARQAALAKCTEVNLNWSKGTNKRYNDSKQKCENNELDNPEEGALSCKLVGILLKRSSKCLIKKCQQKTNGDWLCSVIRDNDFSAMSMKCVEAR